MLFLVVDKSVFRKQLFKWYSKSKRVHPWIKHRDPYKIWLYEIIMQQTRISQGTPYYEKFVSKYPSVEQLAKGDINEILKLWEGLGYYSRARNLHHAAKQICLDYDGQFPQTSKELLKLKGIGKYTSAAIATFAYDEKVGVVDGNVYRVLARVFGIAEPIDETQGKKIFDQLAQELVDPKKPALYNQAIMDFGALQCTPKQPQCNICTMAKDCIALNDLSIESLPFKSKKLIKKTRFFNYLVIASKDKKIIRQRVHKDVWRLLFEYPYIEEEEQRNLNKRKIKNWLLENIGYTGEFEWKNEQKIYKQQLTHQSIIGSFYKVKLVKKPDIREPYKLISKEDTAKHAFPKILDCYLNDNSISLFE